MENHTENEMETVSIQALDEGSRNLNANIRGHCYWSVRVRDARLVKVLCEASGGVRRQGAQPPRVTRLEPNLLVVSRE